MGEGPQGRDGQWRRAPRVGWVGVGVEAGALIRRLGGTSAPACGHPAAPQLDCSTTDPALPLSLPTHDHARATGAHVRPPPAAATLPAPATAPPRATHLPPEALNFPPQLSARGSARRSSAGSYQRARGCPLLHSPQRSSVGATTSYQRARRCPVLPRARQVDRGCGRCCSPTATER